MSKEQRSLNFWRHLSNLWGILTLLLFIVDFFSFHSLSNATSASAVIYGVILSMYAGSKEIHRWKSKSGEFISRHLGEIYPVIWTVVMVLFILLVAIKANYYKIPTEFPATYIAVLGVYILSLQSKNLKNKSGNGK